MGQGSWLLTVLRGLNRVRGLTLESQPRWLLADLSLKRLGLANHTSRRRFISGCPCLRLRLNKLVRPRRIVSTRACQPSKEGCSRTVLWATVVRWSLASCPLSTLLIQGVQVPMDMYLHCSVRRVSMSKDHVQDDDNGHSNCVVRMPRHPHAAPMLAGNTRCRQMLVWA